jgi:hypothetical protein
MSNVFRIITVDQLIHELDKYNHKELHVHHTWKPNHGNFNGSNHFKVQQGMKDFHVNTNKWGDIAQHVSLFPDGKFVTGRDFGWNPASIKGYNTGAFCVEMIGNFDLGHDRFKGEQKEAMIKLAKYFYDKEKYIRFHRENSSKTCPGTSINKDVFMHEVKTLSNIPKGSKGDDILQLKQQWQWDMLSDALLQLHNDGILNSLDWHEKAKNKELTVSELAWLNTIILTRKEGEQDEN